MISLKLSKKSFCKSNINSEYLEILNISNIDYAIENKSTINQLINYFNSQFNWSEMFDFDDVLKRIKDSHIMFLLLYKNNPIGYVFFQPISDDELYLYNLYVTKIVERPALSPIWFVNKCIEDLFKQNKIDYISCDCEVWNDASHNVFIKNNFVKNNILKK